mmetsp:Transcript_67058/g.111496  ORF Transcript_67058/g.111496 Transcript_67058/m.111496 type:complete len:84 (-) Transcript_67058:283-534(-)
MLGQCFEKVSIDHDGSGWEAGSRSFSKALAQLHPNIFKLRVHAYGSPNPSISTSKFKNSSRTSSPAVIAVEVQVTIKATEVQH